MSNTSLLVRSVLMVAVSLGLAACSSAPMQHSDYRLPILNSTTNGYCQAADYRVVVSDLMLSDGLLLQRSDTQIHAARHHRWSGSLEQQLQQSVQRVFGDTQCAGQLTVTVMDFYGNNQGQAVVAGHWQYVSSHVEQQADSPTTTLRGSFNQRQPLKQDGYDGLVNALNQAWRQSLQGIKTATAK